MLVFDLGYWLVFVVFGFWTFVAAFCSGVCVLFRCPESYALLCDPLIGSHSRVFFYSLASGFFMGFCDALRFDFQCWALRSVHYLEK